MDNLYSYMEIILLELETKYKKNLTIDFIFC